MSVSLTYSNFILPAVCVLVVSGILIGFAFWFYSDQYEIGILKLFQHNVFGALDA